MEIIPAIDLRGGRCVRLYQGDFSRESVFSDDPVETALRWEREGAPRLHVVDLDGAARGRPQNARVIERIVKAVGMPVQVGGGIRDMDALLTYLGIGVQRVVLGTAALEDSKFVEGACRQHGQAVVIGVDARNGYVATSAWTQTSNIAVADFVRRMEHLGAHRFIYTDISRDGTLTEPNFEAVSHLLSLTEVPVIASGGISSIRHLVRLQELGVEGAIIGRALYTGDMDLKKAIKSTGQRP